MKRADLIRHIESHGCVLVREGGNHTVYRNPATSSATTATSSATTVPSRREIKKQLARKICDDLGIPRREQSTERRSLPKPEAVSWVWENSDGDGPASRPHPANYGLFASLYFYCVETFLNPLCRNREA